MLCADVQDKLDGYLGGDLDPETHGAIEAHLRGCSICAQAVNQAGRVRAVLRQCMAPPVPQGFYEQVMARARERRRLAPVWLTASQRGWRVPVIWRAAMAAGLIVGLAIGALTATDLRQLGVQETLLAAKAGEPDATNVYRLDYFASAPTDSLAGAFVSLVSFEETGERR
ncbi:MAG: zf-HC2 domain-containing protein [Candidatus Brocadiae bacterium]|nr:zf-HC2 domain-containing protein [Candidatus Brocadiia bacterium]